MSSDNLSKASLPAAGQVHTQLYLLIQVKIWQLKADVNP